MTIQIACCIDDTFAPYLAALINSIAETTNTPVTINVVGVLDGINKYRLSQLETDKLHVTFIENIPELPALRISKRFEGRLTQTTYWRIALPQLFPTLDKILFLDADMLVTGDLANLWSTPVSDTFAAVVADDLLNAQQRGEQMSLIGGRYFNAGMMLMNLHQWREHSLADKVFGALNEKDWEYNDQDALNLVLNGHVRFVSADYNTQTYAFSHGQIASPVIIHFTGYEKPWHRTSNHPYTEAFRKHLNQTAYAIQDYPLCLDNEDENILQRLTLMLPEGGDLILWGAGMRGRRLALALGDRFPQYNVLMFVDSSVSGTWKDWRISSPQDIKQYSPDAVIIATLPARDQIVQSLHGSAFKII